jgi:hypothetical protein
VSGAVRRRLPILVVGLLCVHAAANIGCSGSAEPLRQDGESTTLVRETVFKVQCRCHWGLNSPADLDLALENLEPRLVRRRSVDCENQMLVVPGDPDSSYLFRKLIDPAPRCGTEMPPGTRLSEDDLQLVRSWIASLRD